MPLADQVATVIANGVKNVSTMASESSAFDVWTQSYDGISEGINDFANDPVGAVENRLEQVDRIIDAMGPENWASSSGQQVKDSVVAQLSGLGDQLDALGDNLSTNPDGSKRPKTALEYVGQSFQLLTGVEQALSSLVSVIPFPAFPAIRVTDMDVGLPHGHMHPPNLAPPVIPTVLPFPSTGPIIPIPFLSGAAKTLINGMPAARCGDMGLGVWCGGFFPMFEVLLGSSNVWIEGSRAGRVLCDITKHCIFRTPKPQDMPVYTFLGSTITSSGNVMIGGVPMPSLLSLGIGAAFKGLFKVLGKGARAFNRATKSMRQQLAKRLGLSDCFLKCKILRAEPVNVVTGEVVVDQQDFSMPGRIPLEWNRHYGSGSERLGSCGYGWESPADMRLEILNDGPVIFHHGQSGSPLFSSLPGENESVLEFVDGATLSRQSDHFVVKLKSGLYYYFRVPENQVNKIPVETIADQHGNYLRFVRDSNGLKKIVESTGRYIEVQSRNGLIEAMYLHYSDKTQPVLLVRYEYDPETPDLIAVYDALEKPYQFEYLNHCCVRHTDRNNLSFYYQYDEHTYQGRCVHTWGDSGLYDYRLRFNPLKNETAVTDSLGHVSTLEYNAVFQVLKEVDALNGITLYEYDEVGRTSAVVDPDGNRTEYEYDERGNLLKLTRPDGGCVVSECSLTNEATRVTDPNGGVWQQEWNEHGLLTRQLSPQGSESLYDYDRYGQLISFSNPMGARTTLTYDGYGHLSQLTDALHHSTVFEYDMLGGVITRTDPLGQRTTYDYDLKGRLRKSTLPSGSTITCAYDGEDNLTRYVDENGGETRLEYFGQGEIKRRIQPDGHSVEYHYDTEEQLIGLTNQRGERYQLIRDPLGRIIEEIDYWGQARRYSYSGAGHLKESVDPLGQIIRYETDSLGHILKKMLPDPINPETFQTEKFGYDANGNLTVCENTAIRIERSFDAEGRLLEEQQGQESRVRNCYDRNGNRVSRETQFELGERHYTNTVHYQYDALEQATGIEVEGHDSLQLTRNALGQVTQEHLNRYMKRDFAYSPDGYLTAQRVLTAERPVFEQNYRYDRAGNLVEKRDSRLGVDQYTYDPIGRLVSHLNPEGRLRHYLNDPAGDRLGTRINPRSEDASDLSDWRREGEYDGVHYRFDRAGNLVDRQETEDETHFSWDANQRLIESDTDSRVTRYQYDCLGRRISKETDGVITRFFWDGDALLGDVLVEAESNTADTSRLREWVYYPETFEPLAMLHSDGAPGSELYFYHNDPNGCPIRLLDEQGGVVWAARYSAWGGVEKLLVDRVDNPLRLQGQYWDGETGLCYNRTRYYELQIGQFISRDLLSVAAGTNLYQYAPNSNGWIDPLGLTCKPGYHYRPNAANDPGLSNFVNELRRRGVDVRGTNLDIIEIKTGRVVGEVDVLTDQAAIQYKHGSSSAAAIIDQIKNKTDPFVDVPVVGFIEGAGGKSRAAQRTVDNAVRHVEVTNNIDDLAGLIK